MEDHLSKKDIQDVISVLKSCSIPPEILDTQAKVDYANFVENELGTGRKWKLGDHCYRVLCA